MSKRYARDANSVVVLHNAVATLPAPSAAGDGGAVPTNSDGAPTYGEVQIDGGGTLTMTGPNWLCASDAANAWRKVALLNGGLDIKLTATLGYSQLVRNVGKFKRLAVFSEGGLTASTATVKYIPHPGV